MKHFKWLGAVALFAMAAGSAQAATLGTWRFEAGAPGSPVVSALDSSGNGHNGAPVGNPTYSSDVPAATVPATGAPNTGSLELDGNDYVSISAGAGGTLDPTSAFTVEFWMNIDDQGPGQWLAVDKSHGWTDSTGWLFQGLGNNFGGESGKLDFGIGLGGGGTVNFSTVRSTMSLMDNQWHHIAGTYDSTTSVISLYIDGILDNSVTVAGSYASNGRSVNIGASWHGTQAPNRFLIGDIDELRISDTALTSSQFLNGPLAPVPLPAGLPFLLGALGALVLLRARRWA